MAKAHVDAPAQVCKVGDVVQVKVMEIDLERRRISLSIKAAAETLGTDQDEEANDAAPADEAPAEDAESQASTEA